MGWKFTVGGAKERYFDESGVESVGLLNQDFVAGARDGGPVVGALRVMGTGGGAEGGGRRKVANGVGSRGGGTAVGVAAGSRLMQDWRAQGSGGGGGGSAGAVGVAGVPGGRDDRLAWDPWGVLAEGSMVGV